MKKSFKTGLGFGVTSGIITTLGLIIGLHAGTDSLLVIVGGILTIAIADSCSDALGIHMSQQFSDHQSTHRDLWEATIITFITKFIIAMLFLFPILLLPLHIAITGSIIWGIILLAIFSYIIAKEKKIKPLPVILKNLSIIIIVMVFAQLAGTFIKKFFI